MPSPARTQAGRTARGRPRAGRIKRASCEASDEKLEKTWSAVGTLYLRRGGFNHKDVEADLKGRLHERVRLYEGQMERSRSKKDRYRFNAIRRSSVETSWPRVHCDSSFARSLPKPSVSRFSISTTSASACSTAAFG